MKSALLLPLSSALITPRLRLTGNDLSSAVCIHNLSEEFSMELSATPRQCHLGGKTGAGYI